MAEGETAPPRLHCSMLTRLTLTHVPIGPWSLTPGQPRICVRSYIEGSGVTESTKLGSGGAASVAMCSGSSTSESLAEPSAYGNFVNGVDIESCKDKTPTRKYYLWGCHPQIPRLGSRPQTPALWNSACGGAGATVHLQNYKVFEFPKIGRSLLARVNFEVRPISFNAIESSNPDGKFICSRDIHTKI